MSTFHRFTEPSSFFVASSTPRPIGFEVAFTIQLRDGQRMLHGCGPVLEVWTDANGPFGRPGIRIGVRQLTAASAKMFTRLREAARLHAIARAVVVLGPPVAAPAPPPTVLAPTIVAPGSRPVVATAAARPTATRGMKAIGVPAVVPAVVRPVVPAVVAAPVVPAPVAPAPVVVTAPVVPAADPVAPGVTLPLPDPAELLAIPRAVPAKHTQKLWMPPSSRKTERQRVVSTMAPWPRRLTTSIPIPVEQPGILPANPLTDFSDDMIDLLVETGGDGERGGFTIEAVGNPAPATGAIPVIEAHHPVAVVTGRAASEPADADAIGASTSVAIEQVATAIAAGPRPWRTAGVFAAAVVVIGLTIRVLTPEGSAGAASRPAPRATATTIVQVPVLMFTPMATAVPPIAAPPAAAPPVHSVGCKLAIEARPARAVIKLDGRVVGRGSMTIDSPCRRRRLTVSRHKFKSVTRWVTPKRDSVTPVTVELARPTHQLIVSTSPGGATVTVDGKPAGVTPIAIKVPGFDRVKVKIARRGYRTITRTAVTSSPKQKLSLRLIAN